MRWLAGQVNARCLYEEEPLEKVLPYFKRSSIFKSHFFIRALSSSIIWKSSMIPSLFSGIHRVSVM
jgi:hypothetical protein